PAPRKNPAKIELKVVQIGNSRGVRLPKTVLDRYEIKDALVLEAREEGLLLRGKKDKRLTWEETYRETAREKEDWSDLDATVADGIEPREHWGRARVRSASRRGARADSRWCASCRRAGAAWGRGRARRGLRRR